MTSARVTVRAVAWSSTSTATTKRDEGLDSGGLSGALTITANHYRFASCARSVTTSGMSKIQL